ALRAEPLKQPSGKRSVFTVHLVGVFAADFARTRRAGRDTIDPAQIGGTRQDAAVPFTRDTKLRIAVFANDSGNGQRLFKPGVKQEIHGKQTEHVRTAKGRTMTRRFAINPLRSDR